MKKFLSLLLVMLLVFSALTFVFAESHEYKTIDEQADETDLLCEYYSYSIEYQRAIPRPGITV